MAKKNIYTNEFKTSSKEESETLKKDRVDYFKSTKEGILYSGKDNANYQVFKSYNKNKESGVNRYFIDKNDGTQTNIYKVKNSEKAYSPFKNSELVYTLSMRNSEIVDGKRVLIWEESGVKEKY